MFQTINDVFCYVVDIEDFPPPTPIHDGGDPVMQPYAEALTLAIKDGIITAPGKYAIHIYYEYVPFAKHLKYNIYNVVE